MATSIYNIYEEASLKMIDRDLPNLDEQQLKRLFMSFLNYARSNFTNCKKSLEYDEVLEQFQEDFDFREKEILAQYMRIAWLDTFISHQDLLKQNFGNRDFQLFSDANKLKEMKSLRDSYKQEVVGLENIYTIMSFEQKG